MTISERVERARLIEPIERGKTERKEAAGDTRIRVAKAVGMSYVRLAEATIVCACAERMPEKYAALVEQMNRTNNVQGAFKRIAPEDLPESRQPKKPTPQWPARLERMRQMAESGYTVRQIAGEFSMTVSAAATFLKQHGVVAHASDVIGRVRHHDANRIVSQMVLDAENLTADVALIEFDKLEPGELAGWLCSLASSRKKLDKFISRLRREQDRYGENRQREAS